MGYEMQLNTAQKCLKRVRPAKESNISAIASPRITKFRMDLHADLIYNRTGYDIGSCFLSVALFMEVRKNDWKCRLRRRFRVEFLVNGLSEGHEILHTYRGQPLSQTCRI